MVINSVESRTEVQEDKKRHFSSVDGANKVVVDCMTTKSSKIEGLRILQTVRCVWSREVHKFGYRGATVHEDTMNKNGLD